MTKSYSRTFMRIKETESILILEDRALGSLFGGLFFVALGTFFLYLVLVSQPSFFSILIVSLFSIVGVLMILLRKNLMVKFDLSSKKIEYNRRSLLKKEYSVLDFKDISAVEYSIFRAISHTGKSLNIIKYDVSETIMLVYDKEVIFPIYIGFSNYDFFKIRPRQSQLYNVAKKISNILKVPLIEKDYLDNQTKQIMDYSFPKRE